VAQFDKGASQTRDYCVAKYATHRAARLDPSLREERLLGMTNQTEPRLSCPGLHSSAMLTSILGLS
jgi:hypothetical protein